MLGGDSVQGSFLLVACDPVDQQFPLSRFFIFGYGHDGHTT
jgi:hypothetical protein